MPSIADRLVTARRNEFVGREAEQTLFCSLLREGELPFSILHLQGAGGMGKSALLRVFTSLCARENIPAHYLDARNIEPSAGGFREAVLLSLAGSLPEGATDPFSLLAESGRRVLLIDTCEHLDGILPWLREMFLPRLSAEVLVVMAGRTPFPADWLIEPGWQNLIKVLPMRNLSDQESQDYLYQRSVPEELHRQALDFTHGHPLALALVADVLRRDVGKFPESAPETSPDVIQPLLMRFLETVPSAPQRFALEACALLRVTDEAILREMLRPGEEERDDGAAGAAGAELQDQAHILFAWLHSLSFIEAVPGGLFPHDVVREALLADLRWRDRDRYRELHRRARGYFAARLVAAPREEQQRLLYDCIFLHRDNAVVRAAFTWQEDASAYPDSLQERDASAIVEMVERWEGSMAARIARNWLIRQPDRFVVFRDHSTPHHAPVGFFLLLQLNETTPEDRADDPVASAAWNYLEAHAPLRAGEAATYLRFWMARDTYQRPSIVQSLIAVHALRRFLIGPPVAFTFFACAEPDFWEPVFAHIGIRRLFAAESCTAEQPHGVFGSDWRTTTTASWLERLYEREVAAASDAPAAPNASAVEERNISPSALLVLSQEEFAAAVRTALKTLHVGTSLRENPLLRSRIVHQRAGRKADPQARLETLRQLLRERVEHLRHAPRLARGYRALYRTYLDPTRTQEEAAEALGLPFNTYRRHLGEGIVALTNDLWGEEIGSAVPSTVSPKV